MKHYFIFCWRHLSMYMRGLTSPPAPPTTYIIGTETQQTTAHINLQTKSPRLPRKYAIEHQNLAVSPRERKNISKLHYNNKENSIFTSKIRYNNLENIRKYVKNTSTTNGKATLEYCQNLRITSKLQYHNDQRTANCFKNTLSPLCYRHRLGKKS